MFPAPGDIMRAKPATEHRRAIDGIEARRRCPVELLLTNLEIRALKETLEMEVSNLRMEIVTAKAPRIREELITRKELLLSILEKMPAPVLDVA
jgi:hypothetical protein